jgi:excisionase family DNA binding protein
MSQAPIIASNEEGACMADKFYTVKELAATIKVTEQSVHNWIKAGKIVSIKFGRTRRIPAEEYERVVREGVPEDNGAKLTPDLASA